MSEEEQTEVVEEQPQIEVEQTEQEQKSDIQAENWKKANEILKQQKREIEELRAQMSAKPAQPVQPEKDEFDELDPEDYLTVGKARELAKKLASREASQTAKQVVQEYIQQRTIAEDEADARAKFEDYDYVIENYAIPLIKNDPALAYKIQNSKNPAKTAYKLGKLSDDYEEQAMTKTNPKAEKILKNAARPVSSNAAGNLRNQADQFSKLDPRNPSDANKIYELSQKYARGA